MNGEPCSLSSAAAHRIIYSVQNTLESNYQIALERPGDLPSLELSMSTPRILLADDQEEMLGTVILVLGDEFNIIGTADNGKHAVGLATELFPDVLVLDISMPILNGIEVARSLKELGSRASIVLLSVHADPDFVEAARSAGALGYVLKESLAIDLAPAIRTVIQGNTFTSSSMRLYHSDTLFLPD